MNNFIQLYTYVLDHNSFSSFCWCKDNNHLQNIQFYLYNTALSFQSGFSQGECSLCFLDVEKYMPVWVPSTTPSV